MEAEEFMEIAYKYWPEKSGNLDLDVYWEVTDGDEETFEEFIYELEQKSGIKCEIELSNTFPFVWSIVPIIEGWFPLLARRFYGRKYVHLTMGQVFDMFNSSRTNSSNP